MNLHEKRDFQRITTHIPCSFVEELYRQDYSGTIVNISESGFCFTLDEGVDQTQFFKHNSVILFQFIDLYPYLSEEQSVIVDGRARVIWSARRGGKYFYGCRVSPNANYEQFVQHKKAIMFIKNPSHTAFELKLGAFL